MTDGEFNHQWCERLYRERAAELLLYGRALGLSHAEAEDVLQGTFQAMLVLEIPPRNPEFYCVRSFRNRAFNYRRSWWRRIWRELESRHWFEDSGVESEREHEAKRALIRLPMEQREVIVLKIWHDYTFDEIGRILRLSPNTVAGRYRYGLQKLRIILDANDYEQLEWMRETDACMETPRPG